MAQKLRFAVVCSSNMNRSMEAHSFLQKKGYDIKSYGTGNMIKVSVSNDKNLKLHSLSNNTTLLWTLSSFNSQQIPGESERKPNTYPFGTTYDHIFADLTGKDKELYTKNGMLHIMERNRRIKVHSVQCVHSTKFNFNLTSRVLRDSRSVKRSLI